MNCVTITGTLAGDSELRMIGVAQELLNFDLCVDGRKGEDPILRIGYFPRNGDVRKLEAGRRVMVVGALRHRVDSGLFVAAKEILIFA